MIVNYKFFQGLKTGWSSITLEFWFTHIFCVRQVNILIYRTALETVILLTYTYDLHFILKKVYRVKMMWIVLEIILDLWKKNIGNKKNKKKKQVEFKLIYY